MTNILVLDTETTGVNQGRLDTALQVALCDIQGNEVFQAFIAPYPDVPPGEGALAVTGKSLDEVSKYPSFSQSVETLTALLNEVDLIVGYNVWFDYQILMSTYHKARVLMPEVKVHDVMTRYAEAWGEPHEKHEYKSQKLTVACEQQGIAVAGAHDAMADAKMTAALYRHLQSGFVLRHTDEYAIDLVSITKRVARNGKPYAAFVSRGGAFVNIFDSQYWLLTAKGYPIEGWLNKLEVDVEQPLSKAITVRIRYENGYYNVMGVVNEYTAGK